MITEVESGAEVASGMAVEPQDCLLATVVLIPECVALGEVSGEPDAACHYNVNFVPELRQVGSMYSPY